MQAERAVDSPSDDPPRAPRRRLAPALLGAAALGLLGAEAAFRWRDGGAFPLVNVYEADPEQGVRLRPGAATRVRRPGQRATEVRVNARGHRGPDWPAPGPGQALVIGDSQAFGLGVDEGEALAARLSAAWPGRPPVLDASVPTHGPPEYLRTLARLAPERAPSAVVVVLNPMNDLFEIDRPAPARLGVVDGWAVRRESMPPGHAPSRARRELVLRSHAAFALWRLVRAREAAAQPPPAGPSWPELIAAGRRLEASARPPPLDDGAAALAAAEAERDAAHAALLDAMAPVKARHFSPRSPTGALWGAYLAAAGEPADQVLEFSYGGCAPLPRGLDGGYRSTYQVTFAGARIRRDVEDELRRLAADPGLRSDAIERLRAALARRDEARRALDALRARPRPAAPPPAPPPPTPLDGFWRDAARLTRAHGARLVAVVLPLALEHSPRARQREGADDEAAPALGSLRARLLDEAARHGALPVDPAPQLTPLGDRAYQLDGHLSAEGHQAVASAIVAALPALAPGAE